MMIVLNGVLCRPVSFSANMMAIKLHLIRPYKRQFLDHWMSQERTGLLIATSERCVSLDLDLVLELDLDLDPNLDLELDLDLDLVPLALGW